MKRRIKRLTPVSPENGHAIPGRARPRLEQSTPKCELNHFLVSSNPSNRRPPVPEPHQSNTLVHAIRLTSNHCSLQSP